MTTTLTAQPNTIVRDEDKKQYAANNISLDLIDSVTICRLVEEVRQEQSSASNAYNRVYNRHHRS